MEEDPIRLRLPADPDGRNYSTTLRWPRQIDGALVHSLGLIRLVLQI
jgi:hypothetical protein